MVWWGTDAKRVNPVCRSSSLLWGVRMAIDPKNAAAVADAASHVVLNDGGSFVTGVKSSPSLRDVGGAVRIEDIDPAYLEWLQKPSPMDAVLPGSRDVIAGVSLTEAQKKAREVAERVGQESAAKKAVVLAASERLGLKVSGGVVTQKAAGLPFGLSWRAVLSFVGFGAVAWFLFFRKRR